MGGRGWAGWSGVMGEWDNCNSIINKYIFKKLKETRDFNLNLLWSAKGHLVYGRRLNKTYIFSMHMVTSCDYLE